MSDGSDIDNGNDALLDLAERAKCLGQQSVKTTTRQSHSSHWTQFANFCKQHGMPDPSDVTDESPNHVSYFITSKFNDNKASGTCENIRSAIKHHYKRVITVEDRWRKCDDSENYVGNPCDALAVTELIKGIENVSRQRGDTARRAAPMTMDVLNKL